MITSSKTRCDCEAKDTERSNVERVRFLFAPLIRTVGFLASCCLSNVPSKYTGYESAPQQPHEIYRISETRKLYPIKRSPSSSIYRIRVFDNEV